jgi:hypothetical protein
MKKQVFSNKYVSDTDFTMLVYRYVEKYLKLKKSYEIAKRILSENCHDFFISMDFECEKSNYNNLMYLANKRNLDIDVSMSNLECSIEEVSCILKTMCGLELTWLDEHRYIFDSSDDKCVSYFQEEDNTLKFYSSLISNLSSDDIKRLSENISDEYMLSLY